MAFSLVFLLSLIALSLTAEVCEDGDSYSMCRCLNSSYEICMKNKEFVDKRWFKGDKSVELSMYKNIEPSVFEKKIMITALNYTGSTTSTLIGDCSFTKIDSYVGEDTSSNTYKAVSTPIGDFTEDDLANQNNYVAYAAIDLMNLVYTLDDNLNEGKVVGFHC